MLKRLMRLIRPTQTPDLARIIYVIASLHDSERLAREKGYNDTADRILAIVQDLDREFGSPV